jgi:uncharacterized protein YbjT (DUF2867 family)
MMSTNGKTIAVTGATGTQGSMVARRMLAEGWHVRALTRDPAKPAAQALAAEGAQVVPGDLDKPAELAAAFQGAAAVYSVQNFWLPNVGFEGEVRQGKAVVDAAKAAGVGHLVYASVGAAHRGEGQRHFDSKYLIEQHLQRTDLPFTILRPVGFMENFNWARPYILNGVYEGMGLPANKNVQYVAVADLAAFTALALARPQDYLGRTIELAGDELTEPQIAQTFARVIGRPVQLVPPQPRSGGWGPSEEELAAMHRFFNGEAYTADIPALRRVYPGLLTLERYLRQNGWENAEPVPLRQGEASWS